MFTELALIPPLPSEIVPIDAIEGGLSPAEAVAFNDIVAKLDNLPSEIIADADPVVKVKKNGTGDDLGMRTA